jgi:UDPglucose 6-dehydrogenase
MEKVYESFGDVPIIQVSLRTAEMIKYVANALLATLISYSNEVASICETIGGIDIKEVLEAVTLDKRLNPRIENKLANPEINQYLRAGCGFGGSCFPKDVHALVSFSIKKGYLPRIMTSTLNINKEQPLRLLSRLEQKLNTFHHKKIAVLGLAFKPGTDDVRESPSITLITSLLEKGARVLQLTPLQPKIWPQFFLRQTPNLSTQRTTKLPWETPMLSSWSPPGPPFSKYNRENMHR